LYKSGYISIIGRPNTGKSTLLNCLIGEKVSIITDKPQTTRNRITGIKNLPEAQLIFLDTPGIHKANTPLNRAMVKTACDTFSDADILLLLVEANAANHPGDAYLINSLSEINTPVILVINKIDLIAKNRLLPQIEKFSSLYNFREIIPVSAKQNDGIEILLKAVEKLLPEGPSYFPFDIYTDATERFIAAEFIREKITLLTLQEIPYSSAVEVDSFKEDEENNLIRISATINVEKESQKAIMIGKKGAMLKNIGTKARLDMEELFGAKVFLQLFVRVRKDWTTSEKMLQEFGLMKSPSNNPG